VAPSADQHPGKAPEAFESTTQGKSVHPVLSTEDVQFCASIYVVLSVEDDGDRDGSCTQSAGLLKYWSVDAGTGGK
jgi:hypothetical protein